ncbi:MAG: hypothetical protein CVU90_02260 [Firmicutes bacterium HGW-Firmicutes-15]|nr:MAG: hypothetical protein CVU90_02260 [Firmicutes bacterium HGW-Firmicutes-15]
MKKKPIMIVLSLVLGITMLSTTAFASISSSSGYEVYKAALKNLPQADSMTAQATVSLSDNGSVILNADGTVKMDSATHAMSGLSTINAGDKTQTNEVYCQNDQTIMKNGDSDVYNVMAMKAGKTPLDKNLDNRPAHEAVAKDVENIVDLLASNFDSNISLDNQADGSKVVSLNLAGSQITPLENAVASLIVKNAAREGERGLKAGSSMGNIDSIIKTSMPQLVDAISLNSVDMVVNIDAQGQITKQTASLKITGNDASGQTHEIVINVDMNLSGINSTTPDTVDLTGKQVNNIQPREFKGHMQDK